MARLDVFLTENGLAESRERAKRMIAAGMVSVNGTTAQKPSQNVSEGDDITLTDTLKYVSRGALKLVKAFEVFPIDVRGKVCADIGASTGGFTQVLLEQDAQKIYAVDVGHDQLAASLLREPRVISLEGINARYMTSELFAEPIGFMCCDLSFISLKQVIPAMSQILSDGGEIAALIKPQFEAGREAIGKNGIVKDRKKHAAVLRGIAAFFPGVSLSLRGLEPSPIAGGDGNIEYLAHLVKDSSLPPVDFDFNLIVDSAFESAKQW